MDIKEIQKQLDKKDISPELRKALEQRKKILENNKEVKK
jgi:hypothetical protein